MKKASLLVIAATVLFSFSLLPVGGIKGSVAPAEGAGDVWAISGTDSLKTSTAQGGFIFPDAKPGTYKVIVEAKAPYKNFEKEGVEVKEGEVTDLGSITLEQ